MLSNFEDDEIRTLRGVGGSLTRLQFLYHHPYKEMLLEVIHEREKKTFRNVALGISRLHATTVMDGVTPDSIDISIISDIFKKYQRYQLCVVGLDRVNLFVNTRSCGLRLSF